jgi:hypothetical protein
MKKFAALAFAALMSFAPAVNADIDNMDIGGDVLFMYYNSDNQDLNDNAGDQTDFFRTEAHLYFQADLDDNITARISVEADRALNQNSVVGNNGLIGVNSDDLEIFLEELFVQWHNALGSNFNVSAGRQFLNYGDNSHADDFNGWWGDGFIFSDARAASPLTLNALGTYETDPFDAIVVQYEADSATVDVAYYIDSEELVSGAAGNDGDAQGILIYGQYFGIEGHQIDLYYNYNEQKDLAGGALGFEGEQHVIGGRAAGDIMPTLAYKLEFSYQFQDQDAAAALETEGFAVQGGLNYHPDMAYNPNIGVIYTLFEEDNGSGFASPFEGKNYGLLAEGFVRSSAIGGFGNFTNMSVINVYGGLEFTEKLAGTLDLYYFLLDDDFPAVGGDDSGGIEVDAQLDYLINNNMTTFIGGGVLLPSDAFENAAGGNDDEAYFVRTGFKVNF